jgi:hypothetical protein
MRRIFSLLPLFSLCAALLCGCFSSPPTPESVVRFLCSSVSSLPAGRLYVLSAPQDDAMHPRADLLASAFGQGALPPEMEEVEDAAFYFSLNSPCELAVFLCKSAGGTEAVARMCLHRLDVLKSYGYDGENAVMTENATVTVCGRWVLLCVSPDPAATQRAFRQAL